MRRRIRLIILLLALLLMTAGVVLSNTGGGLQLDWWTADGGGGVSKGENYLLQGTAGQFDTETLQGETYVLNGGFWQPAETDPHPYKVMLPIVVKE